MPKTWELPGFVDAHCHIGLGPQGAADRATAERQARTDLRSGVTLIRDAGSPIDTHWLDADASLPRIIRAGRHLALPKRYLRGYALELDDPADLPAEVERQAALGDGWVKVVGDWIDRSVGDLRPLWPTAVVEQAVAAAHRLGVRTTAHCFGEDSVAQWVAAGSDCVEHGTGLDDDTIARMVAYGTALVPTLDNIEIFPGIAVQADQRYPVYAAHMRALYARHDETIKKAYEAGVPIYAGSDAGGIRPHGTIADEILALARIMGPAEAIAAATTRERAWLTATVLPRGDDVVDRPLPVSPGSGETDDIVVFDADPLAEPETLRHPVRVVLGAWKSLA